jgi:hypothetical protein
MSSSIWLVITAACPIAGANLGSECITRGALFYMPNELSEEDRATVCRRYAYSSVRVPYMSDKFKVAMACQPVPKKLLSVKV